MGTKRTNLPVQVTSFIGREREMSEVRNLLIGGRLRGRPGAGGPQAARLLAEEPLSSALQRGRLGAGGPQAARLLTLTGSGGTGKTRLALQAGLELLDWFEDGVWLVELAALSDAGLVVNSVASAIGVRDEHGRPLPATLLDWLRERQLLLILDNCEHLVDTCAQIADTLMRGCPQLQILATSRENLRIEGETVYRMPSLQLPDEAMSATVDEVLKYDAVRLFVERAQFVRSDFVLSGDNAPSVVKICRQVEGIPLALELAAARVNALSAEQIASRLADRFRLLTGGSRTALPRQQTLRGTLDWSYGLLSEPERTLLLRLSVFAGGWTLQAAEDVTKDDPRRNPAEGGGMKDESVPPSSPIVAPQTGFSPVRPASVGVHPSDILDLLSQLVNKSLITLDEQAVEPRYRMLETIRAYAREKLPRAESERLRDRHLHFFQRLVDQAEVRLLVERAEWVPRLNAELGNLRAAFERARETDLEAARLLAGRLRWYWYTGDQYHEGRAWYEQVSSTGPAETEGMALVLHAIGMISAYRLALDDAERMLEPSIARWRVLGNEPKLCEALEAYCFVKAHQGQSDAACVIYDANAAILRRSAHPSTLASALCWWGRALMSARGDHAGAKKLLDEALAIGHAHNNPLVIGMVRTYIGHWATQMGDYPLARQYIMEGVSLSRRNHGARGSLATKLGQVGDVAVLQGDYVAALKLYQESLSLFQEVGDMARVAHISIRMGYLAVQQGEFEQAEELFTESLEMTRRGQFKHDLTRCVAGLAELRRVQGQAALAVRLLSSEPVSAATANTHIPFDRLTSERTLSTARAQLGDDAFNAAWEAGRTLTLEQAIAEAVRAPAAMDHGVKAAPVAVDPSALSARESEVLDWVAQGLSDKEIARKLVISVRTVHGHLRSIYRKLDVKSRTAAIRASQARQ